jgi:hypothetical protein
VLINLLVFGHAVPISGEIKSSFPVPETSSLADISRAVRQYPQYYALVPVAWLGVFVARVRRMPIAPVFLVFALGATAQAAYIIVYLGTGLFWWYFVGLVPAGLLAIGVLIELILTLPASTRFRHVVRSVVLIGAAALLAVPVVASLREQTPDGEYAADTGWRVEAERAGHWANTQLRAGVMLAMRDAGAFGYYTRQPVMNLDGVSSSYEYQDALCDGHLNDELHRPKVQYVAYHALKEDDYDHFDLPVRCARNHRVSTVRFERSDEVYRGRPYWHGGSSRFVIWRL